MSVSPPKAIEKRKKSFKNKIVLEFVSNKTIANIPTIFIRDRLTSKSQDAKKGNIKNKKTSSACACINKSTAMCVFFSLSWRLHLTREVIAAWPALSALMPLSAARMAQSARHVSTVRIVPRDAAPPPPPRGCVTLSLPAPWPPAVGGPRQPTFCHVCDVTALWCRGVFTYYSTLSL